MQHYVTPDLCDANPDLVQVLEPMFSNFGGRDSFGGQIVTIKCFEDNSLVKAQAELDGRGKVLVDWSQNSAAKTTIVPYSLRGRSTPTVAAPRTWREISSPKLAHLDYQAVLRRVEVVLFVLVVAMVGESAPSLSKDISSNQV